MGQSIQSEKVRPERIAIRVGIGVAISLIAYFLIMDLFGLSRILQLRFFNGLILLSGILYALNKFRNQIHEEKIRYLEGVGIGFIVSFISSIGMAVFMYFYTAHINKNFMEFLTQNAWFGEYLTPSAVAFALLLEGVASGAVMTFMTMQYLKREPFYSKFYRKPGRSKFGKHAHI